MRIFPNQQACLRLVTALAVEALEEWLASRRYLGMEELRKHHCQERKGEGVALMKR